MQTHHTRDVVGNEKMKIITIILSVIILTVGCRSTKINESNDFGVESIPMEIKRNIAIIELENSIGAIFPKDYQPKFNKDRLTNRFTPTEEEIRNAEIEISNQYLESDRRFIHNQVYERTDEVYENQEIDKDKEFETLMKQPTMEAKKCIKFDRQYIGFVENEQKILLVNFINLNKDKYKQEQILTNEFIIGFGDWFERNTRMKEYNLETKRLNNFGWSHL